MCAVLREVQGFLKVFVIGRMQSEKSALSVDQPLVDVRVCEFRRGACAIGSFNSYLQRRHPRFSRLLFFF